MSEVWVITGAGRGMGLSITKAALAAGHKVNVATGRNPEKVALAVGESADLLVVKLDVTSPADAEAAVKAGDRPVRPHRCAREQCRQLLRRLLRGADAGADGAAAGDQPSRSDERHPRRPAGHAQAAFRADHLDLVERQFRWLRVRYRLRRVEVRARWLDGVAAGRGRAVRHPDPHRQPRLLPHGTSHGRVDELRRALHRGLRRAPGAAAGVLEVPERQAVRRSGQARSGADCARGPGRVAPPLHCRGRFHRHRRSPAAPA